MTSWIRRLLLLALVPTLAAASPPPLTNKADASLNKATPSTTAEPANADELNIQARAETEATPAVDRKLRLETRIFALHNGGLFELAWCDRHEPTTWSMYGCWALNVGRQDERWAAGELITIGARYRPGRGPVTILAGAGAGLLTMMADGFICAASSGRGKGSDGSSPTGQRPSAKPRS